MGRRQKATGTHLVLRERQNKAVQMRRDGALEVRDALSVRPTPVRVREAARLLVEEVHERAGADALQTWTPGPAAWPGTSSSAGCSATRRRPGSPDR